MSNAHILAFAVQGMRVARRSVRTWVFGALAVGAGFALYHYFSPIHVFGQSSAPRFSVPGFGGIALYVLLVGLLFLTFDVRQRDRRERIGEALDVRAFSNFDLLAGRIFAGVITIWLALLALALLLQVFGMAVADLNHRLFGEPPEATALATFLLLDAPPALLFWGGLVMLLDAVLRNRLLVAIVAASLGALHFLALFHTPLFLLPVVSGIANLGLPGSDILPRAPDFADYAQRAAVLALAFAWLLFAAVLTPRRDGRMRRQAACGAALALVGCAILGALTWAALAERGERRMWAAAHEAQAGAARPDLLRVSGQIRIDPGRELAILVDLEVATEAPLDVLRFSLNPGMRVYGVHVDGEVAAYTQNLGFLDVVPSSPLAAEARAVVHVEARGVPNHRFAYLDSALDAMGESLLGSPLVLLGEQSSLFGPDYVALMPAVRWLPHPGANWATDEPPDLHQVDLAVSLPEGWRPAGPGRTDAPPWRFEARTVPDFALIAAPFERRAIKLGDVDGELLMHPSHMRVIDHLADELRLDTVTEFASANLAKPGLEYPHGTLSLVEAPAQLRRYGGGARMGTLQALPGVQLLAEHGLPSARWTARHRPLDDPTSAQAQNTLLDRIDRTGANGIPLSAGFARNLLPFLARATGEGALALNYLIEALTAQLTFNTHVVAPGAWLHASVPHNSIVVKAILRAMGTATVRSAWFGFLPEAVETLSEGTALKDLDGSPAHVDVLIHKGRHIAALLQGVLGIEKTTRLLALMRERHAGGTYKLTDFLGALHEADSRLPPLIEHYVRETALPGFVASPVRVARIRDDENGRPRYQMAVHVQNAEPAPGVVAILWRTGDDEAQWHVGPHAIVPGAASIEIGATSAVVPRETQLATFLSLNRRALQLALPKLDEEMALDEAPWNGSRTSTWVGLHEGLVVDDLDAGFSVTASAQTGFRLGEQPDRSTSSADIPAYGGRARGWQRASNSHAAAWGRYRKTYARTPPGDGSLRAHFNAVLPTAGRWRLSYHLPGNTVAYVRYGRRHHRALGELDIRLGRDGDETRLAFDGRDAVVGWNDLGTFDLPAGTVRVTVSDETTGDVVIADAVRWQQFDGN